MKKGVNARRKSKYPTDSIRVTLYVNPANGPGDKLITDFLREMQTISGETLQQHLKQAVYEYVQNHYDESIDTYAFMSSDEEVEQSSVLIANMVSDELNTHFAALAESLLHTLSRMQFTQGGGAPVYNQDLSDSELLRLTEILGDSTSQILDIEVNEEDEWG